MAVRHRKHSKPVAKPDAASDLAAKERSLVDAPDRAGQAAAEVDGGPCKGAAPLETQAAELRSQVAELRAQLMTRRETAGTGRPAPGRSSDAAGLEGHAGEGLAIEAFVREGLHALEGRIQALEARSAQQEEIARLRLGALERSQEDQEARLRALADSVARLTTTASLAQLAQAAFAVILSAIAAYLGRR